MKRSQVLAVSVVALVLLVSLPFQQSRAEGTYSEKLQVYIAGSNALWYVTFDGISGSGKLASFESSPGLSWYNITAIRTSTWKSDFQVFGPQGYNLLRVPFLPAEGLFLTVGSDSYPDALSAANALDSYMLSAFVSLSNGTSSYTFYSPLSFNDVAPQTLLTFVPTSAGGFAEAISPAHFESSLSPILILGGVKSSSGFDHSLVAGSITNTGLDAQNRPSIASYFGSGTTSLVASNKSTSTIISVKFLDGQVASKDAASVTNDPANFSGSYSISLSPGKSVRTLNATVLQQPVRLLAARLVDTGVVQSQGFDTISISLTNLSNSTAVTNISGSDNWWNSSMFKLARNTSASIYKSSIDSGKSFTLAYVLQYVGTSTGEVTIPPATVTYSYAVGLSTFNGTARTNPVVLSLGNPHAVIFAYLSPAGGYGKSVGDLQLARITMKNVGTQTATGITVAGQQVNSILPGDTASVNASLSASSLLGTNLTKGYTVQYTDLEGGKLTATTNALPVLFSHSSMDIGYPQTVLSSTIAPLSAGGSNLTLTIATSNIGSSNVTSFMARGSLPPDIGCGSVSGTGASCSSGELTITYPAIQPGKTMRAYLKFNITSPQNFFFTPLSFGAASSGLNMTGKSTALAVPTGVVLSKTFTPSKLFGGMVSRVGLLAKNHGPFSAYNSSVTSAQDTFDSFAASANPSASALLVAPGANISASYSVTALSTISGGFTAAPVSSNLFFGGRPFTLKGLGPVVSVYRPLSATITTIPSTPTEGKNFTISIGISNPSGVNVTQVLLTLPVPSGLGLSYLQNAQLSAGVLSVGVGQLGAHGVYNASAVAVATSGITVPFDKAKLTFVYSGVTVNGKLPINGIAIGENVTTRYLLPSAIVFLALLATAYYVRRKAAPTAPASQK